MSIRQPNQQNNREREKPQRRITLHRMQRDAQRSAAPLPRQRVRINDSPAHRGLSPIARPRQQRAQLLEGQSQSQRRGQRVSRCPQRQPLPPSVQNSNHQREQPAKAGQQRMMHHGQRQQPQRMRAQFRPVEHDQQQPRTHKRREERYHAQLPHQLRVKTRNARRALGKKQRQQHAHGSRSAIRRNQK